jgi:C_GCAxxG_C_C family probable redox protein
MIKRVNGGEGKAVSDEIARMTQLHMQGFHCSQIIVMLGLEQQGKSNPDLIRAMNGLARGLGDCGKTCGALTGAVCLLGLYAGRGELEERENHLLNTMIQELVVWFEETFGKNYGGIDCEDILQDDPWNRMMRCPPLVTETYFKAKELLEENGFIGKE